MNKTAQAVLAFIVVFLAGGAIGSVFTLRYVNATAPKVDPTSTVHARPEEFGQQVMRRWLLTSNQLALTPAQREKIRPIFFDATEDLQRAREESAHSYALMLEHMQDEIASILTAQQRDKFYQLIQNQRDKVNRYLRELNRQQMSQAKQQASNGPTE